MRNFFLGFVVGAVVVVLAGIAYVRLGFVDPRADIPVSRLEQTIAMPSLDASVERRATEEKNPIDPSEANLVAGMKLYQTNCASCHGDVTHPQGPLADALYPRAPQFVRDSADMPENQNFYIIQHGIRLSGMPAWNLVLSDEQIWQVTTFLGRMDKLPPEVSVEWKIASNGPVDGSHASDSSQHEKMKMPMK